MKNSKGIESQALVREARNPIRARAADSAGIAVPFLANSRVQLITFLLLRQMMPHTFIIMTQPIPPPIPIACMRLLSQPCSFMLRNRYEPNATSTITIDARIGPLLISTARFGPSRGEAAAVGSWLRSQGFTGVSADPQRSYLRATASVARIDAAFGTHLRYYRTVGSINANNFSEVGQSREYGDNC